MLRRHRAWHRTGMAYDFDLFVIGAGSGGVRASRHLGGLRRARRGRRGAPPRRHLRQRRLHPEEAVRLRRALRRGLRGRRRLRLGRSARRASTGARLLEHKDSEIARLNGVYARLLDEAGVTRIEGRARLVDAHTVAVGERRISAEHILIATGGWPSAARRSPASSTPSPRTRRSISIACPSAWSWSAAATSPSSSRGSSTAWARRSRSSTAASCSSAASTTTCAARSPPRCASAASTCASGRDVDAHREDGRGPARRR